MKKPLQQASLSDTITDAFEVPKNYLHKTVEKKCKKKKQKKRKQQQQLPQAHLLIFR